MRIIFVTPLLWKRLDRAVRRREEGQALVLVALASIALVAIVGLAVDGGMAYLEAQKLQRAADAASLAGVVWVPTQTIIADGRGKLSANANGYKVYKTQYAAGDDRLITDNYNYDDVMNANAQPGQYVSYYAELPRTNQYRVTLGEKAHRYFLGVIGLGDYYIQRTSTAEYSQQIRLGSSFNYLGSTGVLYDPSVNLKESKNQLYDRYVTNRCTQPNPPPVCVGTFWSSIAGPDSNHAAGDAYTPIYDGQKSTTPISRFMPYTIGSGNFITVNCGHATQSTSWFINDSPGSPNAGLVDAVGPAGTTTGSCTNDISQANPPQLNQDFNPDSAGRRNFGYEIGIQVDPNALVASTLVSHTNLNISIYDAAYAITDGSALFGTGEVSVFHPIKYGVWGSRTVTEAPQFVPELPQGTNFSGSFNGASPLFPFYRQGYTAKVPNQNYSYPYTGTVTTSGNSIPDGTGTGYCLKPGGAAYTANEIDGSSFRRCLSQYWVTSGSSIVTNNVSTGVGVNYGAGQPYRFNDMRTRYTLYYPPQAPGVSSVYGNVAVTGGKIGAFEVGDMSIRYDQLAEPDGFGSNHPVDGNYMPIERETGLSAFIDGVHNPGISTGQSSYSNAYCYIVSLNPPQRLANQTIPNYTVDLTQPTSPYTLMNIQPWNDTQFVYACPANGAVKDPVSGGTVTGTSVDYYWGMAFPTPQYPYDSTNPNKTDAGAWGVSATPTVREKNAGANEYGATPFNGTVASWATVAPGDLDAFKYPYKVKPGNLTPNYLDPGQECRISVGSAPGHALDPNTLESPIEPLYQYFSPRMPFNAAYGDQVSNIKLTGSTFTSQYFSRHGWRCNWDFDSDYDPRFNPLKPGSTYNPAGSSSTAILATPLDSAPNNVTNNGFSYYGNGKVEPFFHLTDYTFASNGATVLKSGVTPGTANAVVRPGTYMLHVQVFGGSAANRYSVKAEYENAKNITYTVSYNANGTPNTISVVPVPNVYGISTFSIFTNAVNPNNATADVLFDLAYIAPENAGSTAILQLWDPGDVKANLDLSILEPSPAGNRLTITNTVARGQPITVQVQACPYYLNNIASCRQDPTLQTVVPMARVTGTSNGQPVVSSYYNDMWVFMVFQIPNKQAFDQYLKNCQSNGVPEEACYYFQIDYQLGKGSGNDQTTWQLVVQGSPVHLLK